MPRLPLPSTLEHEFLLKALSEESLRVDGRALYTPRKVKVSFGNSSTYGSVEVSLSAHVKGEKDGHGHGHGHGHGTTRVLVQVSAEIVKPREERPYEGFVVIQNEISPMAGSNYEASGRCIIFSLRKMQCNAMQCNARHRRC